MLYIGNNWVSKRDFKSDSHQYSEKIMEERIKELEAALKFEREQMAKYKSAYENELKKQGNLLPLGVKVRYKHKSMVSWSEALIVSVNIHDQYVLETRDEHFIADRKDWYIEVI